MINITTGVVFLVSSMYGTGSPTAVATAYPTDSNATIEKPAAVIMHDREAVEKYLREQYTDTPILVEIARCESTFSQYDDKGNVTRGKIDRQDVGVMQINERYHADTAEELGYDIKTIEGNVAYAKYLYAREGSHPWKASAKCWSKKKIIS